MSTKNPAAVALGRRGGQARAKKLTPEERSDAARKAVATRWAKIDASLKEMKKNLAKLEAARKKRTQPKQPNK
jgi:hypothetical protein